MSLDIKQGAEAEEGPGALVRQEDARPGENVSEEALLLLPLPCLLAIKANVSLQIGSKLWTFVVQVIQTFQMEFGKTGIKILDYMGK